MLFENIHENYASIGSSRFASPTAGAVLLREAVGFA